jgi:hypothetical protein
VYRVAVGAAVLLVAALTAIGVGTAAAASPPPAGFFGIVPQEAPGEADLTRMEGSVETMRIPVFWFQCEPEAGEYDFGALDAEIGAAAAHGIRVLPFVYGTPAWLRPDVTRPPLDGRAAVAWKRFLARLVDRYGPGGSFWRGRGAALPIRRWQIWNEPNFRLFWGPRVEPAGYAKLLAESAGVLRRRDAGAKIVLAGVAPVGAGMKTWVFLRRLLRVPGVRRDFDYAAIHPYSATLGQLEYQMRKARQALVSGGAGAVPLIVTEIGVASAGSYPSAFVVGPLGQAEFLRAAYARLLEMRHRWRVAGAYWFSWRDKVEPDPHCSFCQGAGLLEIGGRPKPAWTAFRQTVAAARRG